MVAATSLFSGVPSLFLACSLDPPRANRSIARPNASIAIPTKDAIRHLLPEDPVKNERSRQHRSG
jgi:hypothetical protein